MMVRGARELLRGLWLRLPLYAWLVVLWMLLWGQLTWLAFVTGIAVASFVIAMFRLPVIELSGRINLWRTFLVGAAFLVELVAGAVSVAWYALRPGPPPRTAVIRVPLIADDDLIMTHTSVVSSLIPGSLTVEADRERRILYLHVIGADTPADVERQRRSAQRWEERIIRAMGSRESLELLRSGAAPYADRREETT